MACGMTFCLIAGVSVLAQSYTPAPENLQARKEFQDNKFGIFLHWGIYSMTAQGEWYMNNRNIHRDEYAKLASGFYPSKFDAAQWVAQIKASGFTFLSRKLNSVMKRLEGNRKAMGEWLCDDCCMVVA